MVEIPEEEYEDLAECPTCGADIPFDALVCPSCGQEFEEEDEEEVEEEAAEEQAAVEAEVSDAPKDELLDVETSEEDAFIEDDTDAVDLDQLISAGLVEGEAAPEGTEYIEEEVEEEEEEEEDEYEEEGEEEYEEEPEEEYSEEEEEVPIAAAVPAIIEEPVEPIDELLIDEDKPAKMFWIGVIFILMGFFGGPILSYLHDALRIPIGIFKAYENFGWVNWLTTILGTIILGIGVVLLLIGWVRIRQWRERIEALLEDTEPMAEAIE